MTSYLCLCEYKTFFFPTSLEELQIELTNANDNFIYTTKMYDKNTTEMAEKLREIEEE